MPFLTKGKTNWKYILIVLILALIVSGGILSYLRYFKREISSLSKFPEIKKPEKPKIEEETANWVTYKNEEYGFEFKYPKEFAENKFCMARETEGGIEVGRFISISIEDSKGLNLSEYIDSVFPKEFNIESKENITVGGKEAVKIIYSFSGPGAYGEAVFLLKDKKAYLFEFAYGNNPCVAHKLGIDEFDAFEYIISTFKFLEEETANWKTYRNEEYGFEIKYPEDLKIYTDSLPTVVEFGKNEWRIFGIKFYRNVCELPENVKCVSFKDWISKAFSPALWKKETKNIFGIGDYTEIEIIEPFIFGEEKLQGILVKNYITVGAADVIFPLVFIQKNGAIYEIYMEPPPTSFRIPYELNLEPKYDYKGYDKIFNQMLSTFKFLE